MRTAAATLLSVVSFATTVSAASPSALDYAAPASCPDRAGFVTELRARTSEWEESSQASRKFVVRLTVDENGRTRGSLVTETAGKRGTPRVIEGAACGEAMRALSFIVALAIDPDAKPPPAEEPTTAEERGGAPETKPEPPPPPPLVDATPPVPPDEPARVPASSSSRIGVSGGVGFDVLGLAAPDAVLAGSVFGGIRAFDVLDLRVALRRSFTSTIEIAPTRTSLVWTSARFEPCVRVLAASRIELLPCVSAEIGSLSAEGDGAERTASPSELWAAIGAGVRGDLALVSVLHLELAASAFVPLDRTELVYRPDLLAYRAPALGLATSVGLLVNFR